MIEYVTPLDMRELFDEEILVQATNYSDRTSSGIDEERLQRACDVGNQLVDGYIILADSQVTPSLIAVLKPHAARLALDHLASSDPQVREQAKETIKWLESLTATKQGQLADKADPTPEPIASAPTPGVDVVVPGYRWRVTF